MDVRQYARWRQERIRNLIRKYNHKSKLRVCSKQQSEEEDLLDAIAGASFLYVILWTINNIINNK